MTYPTFSNGQVLPASDLNSIGLWLVKSQTVGTGVSSVTVTGAFSADYDNYRIIYSGGVMSGANSLSMNIGGVGSSYYGSLIYCNYNASTALAIGTNNGSNIPYVGGGDTSFAVVDIQVNNPFNALSTIVQGQFQNNISMGSISYRLANTSSYTSFSFSTSAGTITGGTIYVYGYRK